MSQSEPVITIYLTTRNRLEILKRAIGSVLAQSFSQWSLIVVDDCSDDGTQEYLTELAASNPKIEVLLQPSQQGAPAARNRAIAEAKTDLVTGLDDDDEFTPDRLQRLFDNFDPQYAFICSGFYWCYGKRRMTQFCSNKIITLEAQLNRNQTTNQVLVLKERLLAINCYDLLMPAWQDYDLWTRLIIEFGPAKRIAAPTYVVHIEHEFKRITCMKSRFKGARRFFSKHTLHMTETNRINQKFLQCRAIGKPINICTLALWLKSGLVGLKLKFYFKYLLPGLYQLQYKYKRR